MPDTIREMQSAIIMREMRVQWNCPRCSLQNENFIENDGGFEFCRKCGFKVELTIKCEIYFDELS